MQKEKFRPAAMPFFVIGLAFAAIGLNRNGENDTFLYIGIAFLGIGIAFLKASVWKSKKKNDLPQD